MFGIYLHIPFCEKKCSYCDFYSIERIERINPFIEHLIDEITMRAEVCETLPPATSVFFGGGTPSLLSPAAIDRILKAISQYFSIEANAEITMECNPGTITLESLQGYKSAGINRLSFGAQSFNEDELAFLERIHSPEEARLAVQLARKAGFDNVNIDLMFSLPPQTMASWRHTLQSAIALETEHISAYSLIYEEGTPLYAAYSRGRIIPQSEESDAEMYQEAIDYLTTNLYKQYEVSNFAREGRECAHNLTYWSGDNYISFGPSAHGFLNATRYWNYSNLARYNKTINDKTLPIANSETLSKTEIMFERAFLELRAKGIRIDNFYNDFGVDLLDVLGKDGQVWLEKGLIFIKNGRISLTAAGYCLCDELTLRLITILETSTGHVWKIQDEKK